ncbi:MAG: hypothetical protein M1812_004527 [Candelaria pacifica]|nr:MAG: hypothetical protein M1812_004527 [Candelaria pacifica]
MATPAVLHMGNLPYRDQYARWRVRKTLAKIYNSTPDEIQNLEGLLDLPKQSAPERLPTLPEFQPQGKLPAEMKVCIVGAGAAGLFTAMIFDYLKEQAQKQVIPDLHISYEILEAAKEDRLGGRLYTYKFPSTVDHPSGPHDYYDVGAMRFPDNPIMKRTFELFDKLKIYKKGYEHPNGQLIDYYMKGENNPRYYNDKHYYSPPSKETRDPFQVNVNGTIRPEILQDPDEVINKAIKVYRDAFVKDPAEGWKMLMNADRFSARDFLMLPKSTQDSGALQKSGVLNKDGPAIDGPGFNFDEVEWLETVEGGTRWYSQAFSEMVLENLDFDYPETPGQQPFKWYCIEGGANILAQEMAKTISKKPSFGKIVTSIKLDGDDKDDPHNMAVELSDGIRSNKYAAVFNSTTLGAMQRMDLRGAKLNYGTKEAIRSLNYGASCKVGIRFKQAWWIKSDLNLDIRHGGLGKTDLPIRVCVYPSYNLEDLDKPAVLLCSYTWEQDASRMGSMIERRSPEKEELLREVLFHNLALLHSTENTYDKVYAKIKGEYITHHAFDWYHDPYSVGAFAFFGPWQFKELYPDITTPSADGKLIIIGEAASTHHAWVVGALESAIRGVYQFLTRYALIYPEYKKAMEFMEKNTEGPFGPLPQGMEKETAKQQVIVSEARATGDLKDPAI